MVQQYPKPTYKRQKKARNNPVPTINDICRYTGRTYASTHEVFFGSGERQLSIKYSMQVKVCDEIHKQIHAHPLSGLDLALKKEYQAIFESRYGHEFYMKCFTVDYINGY
jgi:hypothetical protein